MSTGFQPVQCLTFLKRGANKMALFKLKDGPNLERVNRKEFKNEQELHELIEKNLRYAMGINLIATEYPIPNGRIDTLGLDESGVPVIIEYKWKKDLSAIVQGLFYLDWVMQNKKPFESIVKDKLGKDVTVNWSTQPRLIIIAQDFEIKELSAINLMGPRVELKKYSLYEGLFNIEDVNIVKSSGNIKDIQPSEERYTLDQLLKKTTGEINAIFLELRDKTLGLSDAVWEKVGAWYVDYRTSSTFASVNIQKNKMKIFIKMGDQKIEDPRKICKPIPEKYGYGLLNTQFELSRKEDLDYAMKLITQAYNYISG
jgi:predicted transport protein